MGRRVIIGTAGHIDHGKSSLVEALTGVRMDRLRQEQERGITIELNFAPFALGDGRVAGVVDVPGHEDFVRTMVAGASGIDILVLVIAADEGIKPQTREHLAIAEQLGIGHGIPVLTKADLVDPEWATLVEVEVAEWLRSSSIAFAPPLLVSATTRSGIDALTVELRRTAALIPSRNPEDLFRLPVDRAFSVAGIGTVVTGTAWSGSIATGDQVMILPARKSARVRSVQSHGRDAVRTEPGMRIALGLAGVAREDINRGDTIVEAAAAWEVSTAFDVSLELLADAPRALASRTRLRLHLGTSEIMARAFPVAGRIEPGSSGLARLKLESPAIARGGDRFVLRSYSPVATIGGGRILDPFPPRRKVTWPNALAEPLPGDRLPALFERRPHGIPAGQLPVLLGASRRELHSLLAGSQGYVEAGEYWVTQASLDAIAGAALSTVKAFHQSRADQPGIPLAELKQSLRSTPWMLDTALRGLEVQEKLSVKDGLVRIPGFVPKVEGGDELVRRVVAHLRRSGLTPPSAAELALALGIPDLDRVLRLAARDGLLEAVERDRYFAREALEPFVAALVELGRGGPVTPGQLRDRLGISRKFLIPLLEWADAKGLTVRTGEGRRLRPGHQLPWTIPVP